MAVRNLLVKPPELDTRVSITLHRAAILALFAEGTQNETDARVFGDGIALVRTRLLQIAALIASRPKITQQTIMNLRNITDLLTYAALDRQRPLAILYGQ